MPLLYIFFADDNITFCQAILLEWLQVQKVLHDYEQVLGLSINCQKSSLLFCSNSSRLVKD